MILKKGDLLIKINEDSLIGLSNRSAKNLIENTNGHELVSLNYVRCPDFYEDFKPTWRYFISIPM
jgi:hypothetical protein